MHRKKMWDGRFDGQTDRKVQDFTHSLDNDQHFYSQDILCSKAHALMLAKQKIISDREAEQIVQGLEQVRCEIEQGTFPWREDLEDVHMNIEHRLTEIIGPVGEKLHTGRSRNDQIATDFRLYISQRLQKWQDHILQLIAGLIRQAKDHQEAILPGYTHLQPAQPLSLAHYLLAYAHMFRRDFDRIEDMQKRVRISPLGAAALGGTTYPLDPQYTAQLLGFDSVFANSLDAVSDRDFVLEAIFAGSLIMQHLSRLCEEIIIWSNPCFGFVHLPDSFATGSSIMPQKKNPDVAELVRGKTGGVYGDLLNLLTIMKALPLAYNRDLQEDKPPFIHTDKTVSSCLEIMSLMITALKFDILSMYQAVETGYLNATEFADYLVNKGMPFRQAHHLTGKVVHYAEKKGTGVEKLSLQELQKFSSLVDEDVYQFLDYQAAVDKRKTPGGTGSDSVKHQLKEITAWWKGKNKENGGSV